MQKYLDRKFARQMKRFDHTQGDEALWALWSEMADAGDIPGAFWSVMRHNGASEQLIARIYGEVHMLSHLVGASTRADLRRLAETQAKVERLEAALAERKNVLREAVAVWKRRTMELERELAAERARREKAERERVSLREMLESRSVAELTQDREALLGQLEQVQDRLLDAQAETRRQTLIIEGNYREEALLRNQLAERDREVAALELALLENLQPKQMPPCGGACSNPENCPCPHLRGKCVLYVGGRSGLKGSIECSSNASAAKCSTTTRREQSSQHLQQLPIQGRRRVLTPVLREPRRLRVGETHVPRQHEAGALRALVRAFKPGVLACGAGPGVPVGRRGPEAPCPPG